MIGMAPWASALGGAGNAVPGLMQNLMKQQQFADEQQANALLGQLFSKGFFNSMVPGAQPTDQPQGGDQTQQPSDDQQTKAAQALQQPETPPDQPRGGSMLGNGEVIVGQAPPPAPQPQTPPSPPGTVQQPTQPGAQPQQEQPKPKKVKPGEQQPPPQPDPGSYHADPSQPPSRLQQIIAAVPGAAQNPRALGMALTKILPYMQKAEQQQLLAEYRMFQVQNAKERLDQQQQSIEIRQQQVQQGWARVQEQRARNAITAAHYKFQEEISSGRLRQAEERLNAMKGKQMTAEKLQQVAIIQNTIRTIAAEANAAIDKDPSLDPLREQLRKAVQEFNRRVMEDVRVNHRELVPSFEE